MQPVQESFRLTLSLQNKEILTQLTFSEKFETISESIYQRSGLIIDISEEDFVNGSLIFLLDQDEIAQYFKYLHA